MRYAKLYLALFAINISACQSFSTKPLIGNWVATDPTDEIFSTTRTDDNENINGLAIVNIIFDKNNRGLLRWKTSASAKYFTYRIVKPGLVKITYNGLKTSYYTFHQTRDTLAFDPYPESEMYKESIEVFCILKFTRK